MTRTSIDLLAKSMLLILLLGLSVQSLMGNIKTVETDLTQDSPKREFRAVWISTVSNLDWPQSEDRGDVQAQKESLSLLLDHLSGLNFNAVIFQVRTECDAFYQSSYEPWSRYLGGAQGTDPGYDPLAFVVEEAHKRGLEVHAWFNPYRINASTGDSGDYYHSSHIYKEHPEWVMEYSNGKKILNPGLPSVSKYIASIVGDVINRYDVDGVHFDDYFYSYGGTPDALDQEAFDMYGQDYLENTDPRGDFRRESVNRMVKQVYDTIQAIKPWVRFGVSPFGIYGNGLNPEGIVGMDAYNAIYCDPLAWLERGLVDYLTPQLYWPTGGGQDYAKLLPWWAEQVEKYNRQLFAGQGTYRLAADAPLKTTPIEELHELKEYFDLFSKTESLLKYGADPWTLEQINRQIEINRDSGALGSVFFRANDFFRVNGLSESILDVFPGKSIVPPMSWENQLPLSSPENPRIEATVQDGVLLIWDSVPQAQRYAVYVIDKSNSNGDLTQDVAKPENLYAVSWSNQIELTPEGTTPKIIAVTAIDPYGNEGAPVGLEDSNLPQEVLLVAPETDSIVGNSFTLSWEGEAHSFSYVVEISDLEDFSSNVQSFQGVTTVAMNSSSISLEGEKRYFWRVAGVGLSGMGAYSQTGSFVTGFPSDIMITSPQNNEQQVDLIPSICWDVSEGTDKVIIQVSCGGAEFQENNLLINEEIDASVGCYQPTAGFLEYTTYYLRMYSKNQYGESNYTVPISFKTMKIPPIMVTISSPSEGEVVEESPVLVEWSDNGDAKSYFVQIAKDQNFQSEMLEKKVFLTNSTLLYDLQESTNYFIRVCGENVGGIGPWSDTREFYTKGYSTGISDIVDAGDKRLDFKVVSRIGADYGCYLNIPNSGTVCVSLFNLSGSKLKDLIRKHHNAGGLNVEFSLSSYPPGIYILRVSMGNDVVSRKFIKP